ncbi:MAG: DNA repair protein RecN [Phascolarctobacterium sp.]|nr:DNA repair protein RecN [Phascolarctobacterium sp.]
MLQSLHVHNFALLEDAKVEFVPGFNVFTGETGAGKSILVDAFGVVLGNRASADYVRTGADSFWVQAVFDISTQSQLQAYLEEQGIEVEDEVFLKRQVTSAGKSKASVNGVQVPLNVLKTISTMLVDIHGQHENQALLKADAPRLLVDGFGGAGIADCFANYSRLYAEYVALKEKLQALKADSEQQDLLLDRYDWEVKEIEAAKLRIGEEVSLEEEGRVLQNSEKIISAVNTAYGLLDEEKAVLSLLAKAKSSLQNAVRYDSRLSILLDNVDSAWITLDDCRQELSEYLSRSDFNSERAVEVQQRLDTIYRLHKKYGGSTEAVLEYLEATKIKYNELLDLADTIAKIEKELAKLTKELTTAADALTAERKLQAERLCQLVTNHIHDLAMPNGVFAVAFEKLERFTAHGRDDMRFMFSANMGEPVNELEKVASGGELSRIALAIKTVMMNTGDVPTMVFDEIDTGVGGVTAQKMAEKIAVISKTGQVLCITHLPQIAAFADRHIFIEKQSSEGRTATVLAVLDEEARIRELMRMTAGSSETHAAYENARELLTAAEAIKYTRLCKND